MTMWKQIPQPYQKGPTLTSDNQCQKGLALTLGHTRNQSSMLKGSALTSDNQCQKGSALIFNHARNQSFIPKGLCTYILQPMSEGLCTHIWSCRNQSYSHIVMDLNPRLSFPGNWLGASIQWMETSLIYDQVGTHPSITSEWPCAYIWSCKTTSYSRIKKSLSPRPSIPGN